MMAPVYLSSQPSSSFPLLELKEDHHHQQTHQLVKIFLSPSSPRRDLDSSLPCPAHHFQDPASGSQFMRDQPCHIDKVVVDQNLVPHRGSISSSDHRSSCEEGQGLSAFLPADQNSDQEINSHHGNSSSNLSLKWMSSKMRIIYKMKNGPDCTSREWSSCSDSMKRSEDCDYQEIRYSGGSSNNSTSNGAVRVCSDCKTTTTPLWRSGPRGPKSLCNACGIRQRKARRAMEAAAAATGTGGVASADASSSRANNNNIFKWHNKLDKKPRSNKNHHNPTHQSKRHNVARDSPPPPPNLPHHGAGMKKQYLFGNFGMGLSEDSSSSGFGRVFPENEAEAAALLLMEISRGLLHA